MSGVPIQLSGDTLYMSSTLIKVMLFIPWHPILVCIKGDIESHGLSISLHRVLNKTWLERNLVLPQVIFFVFSYDILYYSISKYCIQILRIC